MRRMVCACGARRNPAVIRGLGGRIWRAAETPTAWGVGMTVQILHGDCRDVLRTLPDASVDSVVTDPPYELGFMGKKWDRSGVANDVRVWAECLRVLKPGGHLLSFGGTRTWHRMACAVEDAGFEMRDTIAWLYGSGFPKSLDVGKAIDKAAGAEREVVGDPDAAKWDGWGTALKPAHEPIVVARKPFPGTVAANVVAHGTGALNIDACCIGTSDTITNHGRRPTTNGWDPRMSGGQEAGQAPGQALGRWPANVVLDDATAAILDEQSGHTVSTAAAGVNRRGRSGGIMGEVGAPRDGRPEGHADSGGASRFFYCAKAPTKERPRHDDGTAHPTVKPLTLMRWLVRLVTPPGGTILDPFTGSGTTLEAALLEGFHAIGIELEAEYIEIARRRIAADAPLFAEVAA